MPARLRLAAAARTALLVPASPASAARPGPARSCKSKPRSGSVLQGDEASPAGLASPRPADAAPAHRQAVNRHRAPVKTRNDSGESAVKMRGCRQDATARR
ncbi:hypothetical protein PagCFBP13516_23850 [Pantoea agglomerans]|nr:hypothetical protein PagCFBP13505_22855 [Pantoea agglomerans]TKK12335.1 hypothetical protein PagCFBP13516_23850 [Pantoea agglomerans]